MKVLVACVFDAGSQWAHAINVVKMAHGFARLGHRVTIVCRRPSTGRVPLDALHRTYGLTERMRWVQVPRRVLGFRTHEYSRGLALMTLLAAFWARADLVYARGNLFPGVSSQFGFPTIAEKHTGIGATGPGFRLLVTAARHPRFLTWVTISDRLAAYYASQGVPTRKVCVQPDAVDLEQFERPRTPSPSPYSGGPNAVYTGHLYDHKGVPTILEAAAQLPEVSFHLVGGWTDDISRQEALAEAHGLRNVTFHGLKPQADLPPYLWHADVLLLPPSRRHASAAWTSPVKLAEYLASGTPVVATRIPALEDWLTEDEVVFVSPDDGAALAGGVRAVLDEGEAARRRTAAGLQKARGWSYERRVTKILQHARVPA